MLKFLNNAYLEKPVNFHNICVIKKFWHLIKMAIYYFLYLFLMQNLITHIEAYFILGLQKFKYVFVEIMLTYILVIHFMII